MRRLSLTLTLALAACAPTPAGTPWSSLAAQADESGLWIASETALLVVPGNLSPRATPSLTAQDAVMNVWVPFSPNDCVAATPDYGTVHYTLDDCTGSFGLVHATGHFDVTYLEPTTPGELLFHASTHDLVLNGGAVSFEADAAVVHDSEQRVRTITLTIDGEGVGPAGTHFTRHGTQTARWFDTWGCLFVDTGHDTLGVAGTEWQADTSMLTLCVGECPNAGGTMRWTGMPGAVTVSYPGTNAPTWAVEDAPNQAGTFPISCGGI
jgi:hypothetical protein